MDFYRKKVFPALAEGLWLVFLFLDLTNMADSTWVKFAAICLCCLTAFLGCKTADGKLVALALCFTVGADWFLLVRNDHYVLGICLFLIVQLLYGWRLCRLGSGSPALFRARVALSCLLVGFTLFPLWCAAVYFINLCVNAAEAFVLGKKHRAFAWGLLLFILCDICVGAYNLGLFTSFTWWGSWLFYLPSQVLIVLSQETESGDAL